MSMWGFPLPLIKPYNHCNLSLGDSSPSPFPCDIIWNLKITVISIHLQVSRSDYSVTSELANKPEKFVQCEEGGVRRIEVEEDKRKNPALTEEEAIAIARLLILLEEEIGKPQDFEWGMERGML